MKLNLGCHIDWREGYLNVDIEHFETLVLIARERGMPGPPAGVEFMRHDLTDWWPWANDSVDVILANELLEHFDNFGLAHVLQEALRVLVPGGVLQGTTPDFERIMLYAQEQRSWEWAPQLAEGPYPEPADNALHNFCYGWGHKQVFTLPMLLFQLRRPGYVNVCVWQSGHHSLGFRAEKGVTS